MRFPEITTAHPVGARRESTLAGHPSFRGSGLIVGHRATSRGPFILIEDAEGKIRSVRPLRCMVPTGCQA